MTVRLGNAVGSKISSPGQSFSATLAQPIEVEGKQVVGITSGASAPESLVQRLVEFFRSRGTSDVQELEVVQEDVRFMLPKAIRQAMATASA